MRNLFSKGLMAAAAVMMFASCSNEEGVNVPVANGEETSVTLGVTVLGSKAAGDNTNLKNPSEVKNVAVVPFVGENAPQKPIRWTQINEGNNNSDIKTVQMVNTVDRFKVYGNLTDEQYGKTLNHFTLTDADFALQQVDAERNWFAPHAKPYFFVNATSYYKATEGADWESANYGGLASGAITDAKFIKISGVGYAVGTLAVALFNGDADNACVYDNEKLSGDPVTITNAGVKVLGLTISGQNDLTVDLNVKSGDKKVFQEADPKFAFAENKINNLEDALTNGNLFSIVSPTAEGKEVDVNFVFELPAGKFLKLTNGDKIGSTSENTKFFLGAKLKKGTHEVFEKGLVTMLNATVNNWGLASEDEVVSVDAQIGVEFNVDWAEGNIYNVEI